MMRPAIEQLIAKWRKVEERTERMIRAHVEGCRKALSVPVDLCECGGRDFAPSPAAASGVPLEEMVVRTAEIIAERATSGAWPAGQIEHEIVDLVREALRSASSLPSEAETRIEAVERELERLRHYDGYTGKPLRNSGDE